VQRRWRKTFGLELFIGYLLWEPKSNWSSRAFTCMTIFTADFFHHMYIYIMYTYVYINMWMDVYTYMHAYLFIYIHVYMYASTDVYTNIHACMHTYIQTQTNMHLCICTYICTHLHEYMHVTFMRTYTCTKYTRKYIHHACACRWQGDDENPLVLNSL